jgi:hypothetical protein
VTIKEAAAALGLDEATLRTQARNQKLKGRKVGVQWHFTPGQIEAYRREYMGLHGRQKREVQG